MTSVSDDEHWQPLRIYRNSKLTLRAEKENVDLQIAPETQKLNW
jgi:hypothetical protein